MMLLEAIAIPEGANWVTAVITAITLAGSAGAWQYYQNRLKLKYDARREEKGEQTLYRDDLRDRVVVLEQKLEEAQREKDKQAEELLKVMTQLAEYKVRIEFLERENDRLKG
jgi:chromosome segregation ATPase